MDVDVAIAEGCLVLVDVADMLALTIVNGWPDEARFRDATTSLIAATARAARNPHRRVAACGECSMTLWRSGRGTAAVQFEHLCDELTRTHAVDIWCGYSVMSPRDHDRAPNLPPDLPRALHRSLPVTTCRHAAAHRRFLRQVTASDASEKYPPAQATDSREEALRRHTICTRNRAFCGMIQATNGRD